MAFASLASSSVPTPVPASSNRVLMAAIEKENGDTIAKLLSAKDKTPTATAIAAAVNAGGAAAASVAAAVASSSGIADVNHTDQTGRTPLMVAVCGHSAAMIALLLQYGADPNGRTGVAYSRGTALHIAARVDASTKVCELLLEAGADPNARDDAGSTPLIEAAKRGAFPVIVALGKYKADARAVDKAGYCAHYYAKKAGHASIAEKLPVVGFDMWAQLTSKPDFGDHMKQVLQSVKKKKKKVVTKKK